MLLNSADTFERTIFFGSKPKIQKYEHILVDGGSNDSSNEITETIFK